MDAEKKIKWEDGNKLFSSLLRAFTVIRDMFKQMNVGPEIIPWLISNGKKYFIDSLHGLGATFLNKDIGNLQIWKPISISTGGYKSPSDICEALMAGGFKLNELGSKMLEKVIFSPAKLEVQLVIVTVRALGFEEGAFYKDIVHRIQGLGLELCPAEVGPQLRLQYQNQPKGEWLLIAMDPFDDFGDGPSLLSIGHMPDGQWLYGNLGGLNSFWLPNDLWVFLRPK